MTYDADVVVIGGGPAGLTCAMYAVRAGLNVILLERLYAGGQMVSTPIIENYPGFPNGIGGWELAEAMKQQAERFGTNIVYAEVRSVLKMENSLDYRVVTEEKEYIVPAVICASGAKHRKLNVEGEEMFLGRGVSYCVTCDGALYKDKVAAVVGGGNSALEHAVELTAICSEVHLIHRRRDFRSEKILTDRVRESSVKLHLDTVVHAILGDGKVSQLDLLNVLSNQHSFLPVDVVFISIGLEPVTEFLGDLVQKDKLGFIVADKKMHTSSPGFFACGDVVSGSIGQVVAACGSAPLVVDSMMDYFVRHR